MSDAAHSASALTPERRREIERWFSRRGVPQLIEDYKTEPAMDARAAPLISVWLILGTIKDWGTRPDWPIAWNIAGIAGTIAWMGVVWLVLSRLRGRSASRRPRRFDVADIGIIGLLPALPAALIDGNPAEAGAATLGALSGIGLIYIVIGFGLIEIGLWAVSRLRAELSYIAGLMARTLPLLLILVVFLLFATEVWEVAHAMSASELGVMLALLLIVATLLVTTAFRAELTRIEQELAVSGVVADALETPVAPLIDAAHRETPIPRLDWLQRSNLLLLVAVPQLIQAIAVALVVGAFLGLIGLIAIPASVQAAWMTEPGRVLLQFEAIGDLRSVSQELLTVSALLGGIVGLYFSGLAISDPTYRGQQFDQDIAEVRRLIAARAVYVGAVRSSGGSTAAQDPGSTGTT